MGENTCPTKLRPMKDWVQDPEKPGECHPCMLAPVVQWYVETLEEHGEGAKAQSLRAKVAQPDVQPLHIGEELDNIKSAVGQPVRERLEELDCMAQSFEPTSEPQSAAA